MAHTLPVLITFGFAVLFMSCDNAPAPKVPREAGRGLHPAPVPRHATPEPEPAVAAWVNGDTIAESELDAELRRLRSPKRSIPTARRLQVLERMIDEVLVSQWAKEHAVPGVAVDAELHRLTTEVFGSEDALHRHLDERGVTLEEYRSELMVELTAGEELAASAPPDEATLDQLYRDITQRPPRRTLVRLSSVLLDRDADPQRLDPQLAAVDTEPEFKALPGRQLSLGWVDRAAIGDPLARVVFAVEPPGKSQPIRTPGGTEIYWVHERSEEHTAHFRELEPLLRQRAQQTQLSHARAELIRRLREKADIRVEGVAQVE